eukprot:CAMPEP_0204149182 /NCGR_PEP_ID=MMETSP0361-20130328/24186_1 /ASSEMBLY_ACC=CAM_ASM_000343 /TAXON_ID=268821 /ORGANISM="Scrippsiella Hangoei, Strain SHTV-5" /LENGTH=153 /DNA_ID=CAMNT_0051103645 /DNA_START=13 /DNA_END=470 /DNA_ORIENTATION=-
MNTPSDAQGVFDVLQGFQDWGMPTDKVCEVTWSDKLQGLPQHIERYRNSPLMHPNVPDEFKPVVYQEGLRVNFPPPTKALRPPRIRRNSEDEEEEGEQQQHYQFDVPSVPSFGAVWVGSSVAAKAPVANAQGWLPTDCRRPAFQLALAPACMP